MKTSFKKTGKPWIDLGIVALWDYFATRFENDLTVEETFEEIRLNGLVIRFQSDSLILEGDEEKINEELQNALASLRRSIWSATKRGKMWWSGVAQFFFKQRNRPDGFLALPAELVESSKYSNGTCDFCGRSDLQVRPVGASEDPFIVTRDKWKTFYPSHRGDIKICVNCVFASRFSPLKTFFNINRDILNASIMESADLLDSSKTLWDFSRFFAEAGDYRNYPPSINYVQSPLETFMDFLFSTWRELVRKGLLEKHRLRGKQFHVIQAQQQRGGGFLIEHYYVIPDIYRILQIFDSMRWQDKSGKSHNALLQVLNDFYFSRDGERDTILREELSRRVLYTSDIYDVIEDFLYRYALVESKTLSGFSTSNFYIFIERYEKEVMNVDEKILESCKSLGNSLGNLAAETDDKSVLYTLRSTRNLDDFLGALHQTLVRYMDEIGVYRKGVERILEEVNDRNWKRYRALTGIYAILRFMKAKGERKEGKQNE